MYRWILSAKCDIFKHRVNLSEVVLVRPAKALHDAKVARIQKRLTTTGLCLLFKSNLRVDAIMVIDVPY